MIILGSEPILLMEDEMDKTLSFIEYAVELMIERYFPQCVYDLRDICSTLLNLPQFLAKMRQQIIHTNEFLNRLKEKEGKAE